MIFFYFYFIYKGFLTYESDQRSYEQLLRLQQKFLKFVSN